VGSITRSKSIFIPEPLIPEVIVVVKTLLLPSPGLKRAKMEKSKEKCNVEVEAIAQSELDDEEIDCLIFEMFSDNGEYFLGDIRED
jgi:hypothetical protein